MGPATATLHASIDQQSVVWTRTQPYAPGIETPLGAVPANRDGATLLVQWGDELFAAGIAVDGTATSTATLETLTALETPVCAAGHAQGGLYVAFTVAAASSFAAPAIGGRDIVVARYNALGQRDWVRRVGGSRNDSARALCSDGVGGVIVLGDLEVTTSGLGSGTRRVGFVQRFDALGSSLLGRVVPLNGGSDDYAWSAVDYDDVTGTIWCAGGVRSITGGPRTSVVSSIDAAGTVAADTRGAIGLGHLHAIVADDAGGYFAAGEDDLERSGVVLRRGPGGQWARQVAAPSVLWGRARVTDLARVDGAGVVALGSTTAHADPTLRSSLFIEFIDDAGDPERTWVESPSATGSSFPRSLSRLTSGALLAVGQTDIPSATTSSSILTVRTDAAGAGTPGCSAEANSSGRPARAMLSGTATRSDNSLLLVANDLPPLAFGMFLASRSAGWTPRPGGSDGNLCLGGAIGRFNRPEEIWRSSASGHALLTLDLGAIAAPSGWISAGVGEQWLFQGWYRDGGTSNFTSSVGVILE